MHPLNPICWNTLLHSTNEYSRQVCNLLALAVSISMCRDTALVFYYHLNHALTPFLEQYTSILGAVHLHSWSSTPFTWIKFWHHSWSSIPPFLEQYTSILGSVHLHSWSSTPFTWIKFWHHSWSSIPPFLEQYTSILGAVHRSPEPSSDTILGAVHLGICFIRKTEFHAN